MLLRHSSQATTKTVYREAAPPSDHSESGSRNEISAADADA